MLGGTNPWISMWAEPRSTIRKIVSVSPKFGAVYLVSIYVLQIFFHLFSFLNLTGSIYLFFILAFIASPILGMAWLYFSGAILYLTGRWLKGTAPFNHLLAAIAWSKIPMSLSLFMWFVLFVANQEVGPSYHPKGAEEVFIILISLILTFWSGILLFQSIRELQGFSPRRTFVNMLLSWLIFDFLSFFTFVLILKFS
jgi:hypothetical protein